jgi:sulfur carrier protein ThiS adenylyltransferase
MGNDLDYKRLEKEMFSRGKPGIREKARWASVGIAGLGGLGSNIAVSLARSGVGKLVIVDFDVVEMSNLNRQHYFVDQLGQRKTQALKASLMRINPFLEIETSDDRLDDGNIADNFRGVDIVVEALDNPVSKAVLVNAVLTQLGDKHVVAGSGMAGTFDSNLIRTVRINSRLTVCGDSVNEVDELSGVMAPRVGIVASHQANEVMAIIEGMDPGALHGHAGKNRGTIWGSDEEDVYWTD